MTVKGFGENSARVAWRLAAVANHGSPEELSGAIRLAESALGGLPACPAESLPGEDERLELLGAILQAMRPSLACAGQTANSKRDGHDVHLRLLRHLAGVPRPKAACRTASGAV